MSFARGGDPASRQAAQDRLVAMAREAARERLVVSTSGNASVRLEGVTGDRFAISAARARLGKLAREDVLVVEVEGGSVVERGREDALPSSETPLHTSIYRKFQEVGAVLHYQALGATVLACRRGPSPDLDFIPELPVHVGKVGRVPFLPPGSEELAEAVVSALREPGVRLVQLSSHGQVAVGEDPERVLERALFFELACRMVLLGDRPEAPLRRFDREERELLGSY